MEERRKFKRRYLMYYSRVYNLKTGEMLGHLIDITPGGAMIISDAPIETGVAFKLRIDVPEEILLKGRIEFEARSVWCARDINPDFYDTGFELVNISVQETGIIEQMIRDYGFRE